MKTSNKILLVYGALFAVFTFVSLGLNVCRYRAAKPAIEECLDVLAAGRGASVLVVDPGTTVAFHRSGYGAMMAFSRGRGIVGARVSGSGAGSGSGDTLFVRGARNIAGPNSLRRIIRGDETIDVPPASEWEGGEIGF